MVDPSAENYINDPSIEIQWAIRSYQHAETYFRLLCSISDVTTLRLTAQDDAIYEEFSKKFPDLRLDLISEDVLKSPDAKVDWREFCGKFADTVDDYNMATLFRLDASKGYTQENTCIVPRVQFLALEIARNRRGVNKSTVLRQLKE